MAFTASSNDRLSGKWLASHVGPPQLEFPGFLVIVALLEAGEIHLKTSSMAFVVLRSLGLSGNGDKALGG